MNLTICKAVYVTEMSANELKLIDGGAPTRSTSFFYDAFYYMSFGIGTALKEMTTMEFWEQWDDAML